MPRNDSLGPDQVAASGPGKGEQCPPYWRYRMHWAGRQRCRRSEDVERIGANEIVWNGAGDELRVGVSIQATGINGLGS